MCFCFKQKAPPKLENISSVDEPPKKRPSTFAENDGHVVPPSNQEIKERSKENPESIMKEDSMVGGESDDAQRQAAEEKNAVGGLETSRKRTSRRRSSVKDKKRGLSRRKSSVSLKSGWNQNGLHSVSLKGWKCLWLGPLLPETSSTVESTVEDCSELQTEEDSTESDDDEQGGRLVGRKRPTIIYGGKKVGSIKKGSNRGLQRVYQEDYLQDRNLIDEENAGLFRTSSQGNPAIKMAEHICEGELERIRGVDSSGEQEKIQTFDGPKGPENHLEEELSIGLVPEPQVGEFSQFVGNLVSASPSERTLVKETELFSARKSQDAEQLGRLRNKQDDVGQKLSSECKFSKLAKLMGHDMPHAVAFPQIEKPKTVLRTSKVAKKFIVEEGSVTNRTEYLEEGGQLLTNEDNQPGRGRGWIGKKPPIPASQPRNDDTKYHASQGGHWEDDLVSY